MSDNQSVGTDLAVSRNFEDFFSQTLAYAKSGYFKDAKTHSQAVVKCLAGRELGVSPLAAMSGIYIVKDKVQVGASVLSALLRKSDEYDYRLIELTAKRCEIVFTRNGDDLAPSVTFTIEDAETAGLAGKDNYKHHPRNMLFARAISDGVKFHAPDLLLGMPVYTEGDDLGPVIATASGPVNDMDDANEVLEGEVVHAGEQESSVDVAADEVTFYDIDEEMDRARPTDDELEMAMASCGIMTLSDATQQQAESLLKWLGSLPTKSDVST